MIVANDVTQPGVGFEVDTNAVTIVSRDGTKTFRRKARRQSRRRFSIASNNCSPGGLRMSREIADHLRFYQELGVDGIAGIPRGANARCRVPSAKCRVQVLVLHLAPGTRHRSAVTRARFSRCSKRRLARVSRCKLHTLGRKHVVFGVGNPNADLMFVGEAPGADEDQQGEPFVGRAGQLLTKIIEAIDLKREDVYIANVIKCRPPGNRNPEPDEVEQCQPFLFRQIDAIKPKVIVALGKFAAQSLLQSTDPITRVRGREFSYRGATLIPTFHPAYLLRNPSAKREVWEDMKKVRAILQGE